MSQRIGRSPPTNSSPKPGRRAPAGRPPGSGRGSRPGGRRTAAARGRPPKPSVVERRDQGLAGAGGRDDQVPVWPRRRSAASASSTRPGTASGATSTLARRGSDARRIRSASSAACTVAVARGRSDSNSGSLQYCSNVAANLSMIARIVDCRRARTFHSSPSRRAACVEVGRADVRRVEAGLAVEQPRLGMEPGLCGLVGDPHLGAEPRELVERTLLGRARVDARDDAHLDRRAGGSPGVRGG